VIPRIGSSLYTAKHPGRCPNCGSTSLARKGSRTKKFETIQRWQCASCGRGFTPAPPELRAKTYPLRVILDAVTLYNLGYTLAEASSKLKTRSGYRVPSSTLAAWITEHRELTAFAGLADFLEAVPSRCPHDLFQGSARASESAPAFLDRSRMIARQKENFATRLAQLVIPSVGDNYRRHETLQRFMLANDSVTLAVEVPIWLTSADIRALEREHGITLRSKDLPADQTITGHIDFLQVRNGAVHILDYKPDARTNRPFAQLTIYALALTRLVPGLRLFDIKCAWFNEEQYCEFYPRTVLGNGQHSY